MDMGEDILTITVDSSDFTPMEPTALLMREPRLPPAVLVGGSRHGGGGRQFHVSQRANAKA